MEHRRNFKRYGITAAAVLASAFLQAFTMNTFLTPVRLLPSGFTGIAALLESIAAIFGVPGGHTF